MSFSYRGQQQCLGLKAPTAAAEICLLGSPGCKNICKKTHIVGKMNHIPTCAMMNTIEVTAALQEKTPFLSILFLTTPLLLSITLRSATALLITLSPSIISISFAAGHLPGWGSLFRYRMVLPHTNSNDSSTPSVIVDTIVIASR